MSVAISSRADARPRWRPYAAYRPVPVPWLAAVPNQWNIKRLKYAVRLVNHKTEDSGGLPYVGLEHIESWSGRRIEPEMPVVPDGMSNVFASGDVLFGKLRPYLAKVLHAREAGVCTSEALVLRPQILQPAFLTYWMLNRDLISIVDGSTYGSKMPRANWEFIGNLPMYVPPLDEQQAIAAFLDRETDRIDFLIAKKERLIELLQEKRTALISHAVTKGLNPNAPMKDSGIEWIGRIPKSWTVKRVKYLARIVGRIGFRGYTTADQVSEGNGALTLGALHISSIGTIDLSAPIFISWDKYYESPEIMVTKGDILVVQRGSTCGKVGWADSDYGPTTINPSLVLLKEPVISSEYLFHCLSSCQVKSQFDRIWGTTAIPMLSQMQIGQALVCVPDSSEIDSIVQCVRRECRRIDELVDRVNNIIERLREYRSALISAAVTGKINVREEDAA